MLNNPFRHLTLNIEMEVNNQYQCTVNTKRKRINKKTPEENEQTNPDSGMFFKYIHQVSLASQIQRQGRAGK